jgi:uncharacterized membrane protein YebE (DUF533 family)
MDLNRIVESLASSGVLSGLAGGVAAGALGGALRRKGGRKRAGMLLKAGGLAAIGGLAWKVYRDHQQTRQAHSGMPGTGYDAPPRLEEGSLGLLLVRAMIAAARADGHIDAEEQARIFRRVDELSLRDHEKSLILEELRYPASLEVLAGAARDPGVRAQVYAASLLAIDAECPAGRVYLQDLAEILALPPTLVRDLHDEARARAQVQVRRHPQEVSAGNDRAA